MKRAVSLLIPAAFIAVLAAALIGSAADLPAVFRPPAALAVCGIIGVLAWGAGKKLAGRLGLTLEDRALDTAARAGLGLFVLSMAVFALGLARILHPVSAALVLCTVAVVCRKELAGLLRPVDLAAFHGWETVWLLLIAAGLGVALLFCHAPSTWFDALEYHVALPARYLRDHAVRPIPGCLFSGFPQNTEMIYTLGLALDPAMPAQVLNFLFGALLALAVYGVSRRATSREGGLIAVLVLFSVADVALCLVLAGADISMGLYGVLSFAALSAASQRPAAASRLIWLSGALCGMAIGCKYLGLAVLLGLNLALAVSGLHALRVAAARSWLKSFAALNAGALAVSAPWLIKNIVATGNPLFPFFYDVFGGRGFPADRAASYEAYIRSMGVEGKGIGELLAEPFRLSFSLTGFGPFLLTGCVFLAYAAIRRDRTVRLALAFSAPQVAYWLATSHIPRYITPVFGVLAVLPAAGIVGASGRCRRSALRLAALGVAAAALFVFTARAINSYDALPYLFMNESRSHYLERAVPNSPVPAFEFINERLPADARVLLIGECRTLYLDRASLSSSAFDRQPVEDLVRRNPTVEGVRAELQRLGITHLLYNGPEAERLNRLTGILQWIGPAEEARFRALIESTEKLYEKNGVFVLKLRP